jgi:hypothetical protein
MLQDTGFCSIFVLGYADESPYTACDPATVKRMNCEIAIFSANLYASAGGSEKAIHSVFPWIWAGEAYGAGGMIYFFGEGQEGSIEQVA